MIRQVEFEAGGGGQRADGGTELQAVPSFRNEGVEQRGTNSHQDRALPVKPGPLASFQSRNFEAGAVRSSVATMEQPVALASPLNGPRIPVSGVSPSAVNIACRGADKGALASLTPCTACYHYVPSPSPEQSPCLAVGRWDRNSKAADVRADVTRCNGGKWFVRK